MRKFTGLIAAAAVSLVLVVGVAGATGPPNTQLHYSITHKSTQYFHVASNRAGTAKCKLDKKPWYTCGLGGETLRNLTKGLHTFRAKAIDRQGRVDPTPATKTWRVTKR